MPEQASSTRSLDFFSSCPSLFRDSSDESCPAIRPLDRLGGLRALVSHLCRALGKLLAEALPVSLGPDGSRPETERKGANLSFPIQEAPSLGGPFLGTLALRSLLGRPAALV